MAARVIALAPGVWRLPTFGRDLINSFAFVEADGSVTLIDAGLRGATRRLVGALDAIGARPDQVTRILATHAHVDHIGDARRLRARTGAQLQIHEHDAGYVRDGIPPPRDPAIPLGRVLGFLQRRQASSDVDGTYTDDDVLPVAGGLRVLHTPGHSPGHCSFLHEPSGILITGDALVNFRGKMNYSFAASCTNFRMSKDTAARLGDVDYELVAFTHGPEIRSGARPAVREFLRRRLGDRT
jgi:glyoxylase-like metal-dependent hydrolase (beta-lactamase superfamily II)